MEDSHVDLAQSMDMAKHQNEWITHGKIRIRYTPSQEQSERTQHSLQQRESFLVKEEKYIDNILYLNLADGRGWVFERDHKGRILCTRVQSIQKMKAIPNHMEDNNISDSIRESYSGNSSLEHARSSLQPNKLKDLRQMCTDLKISPSGTKEQLSTRIITEQENRKEQLCAD